MGPTTRHLGLALAALAALVLSIQSCGRAASEDGGSELAAAKPQDCRAQVVCRADLEVRAAFQHHTTLDPSNPEYPRFLAQGIDVFRRHHRWAMNRAGTSCHGRNVAALNETAKWFDCLLQRDWKQVDHRVCMKQPATRLKCGWKNP